MANSQMEYREVRFIIEPELTQCYVLIMAYGDSPIGVQGWHHKTFPKSKSMKAIIDAWASGEDDSDPVLWPLDAPPRAGE